MNTSSAAHTVTLEPNDTHRLAQLCGQFDEHLHQIEQRLNIEIKNRGNVFALYGKPEHARATASLLQHLYAETRSNNLTPGQIHLCLQQADMERYMDTPTLEPDSQVETQTKAQVDAQVESEAEQKVAKSFSVVRTKKGHVTPRGANQLRYVQAIQTHDINFGVGPAGTGKTYLAVACAVEAFLRHEVERILLVRPAVEAGEKLGFLPGDLSQKVDPYLRPLYDALYEMMGVETVGKLIERNVIEVAPLAYMRGRTLNNAYIILDESQNTTREQMKMFLTRIGFGSTAVITGDVTQIDLPRGTKSGLIHGCEVLDGVEGIAFTHFLSKDVVRHPLVQKIVDAYATFESNNSHDN